VLVFKDATKRELLIQKRSARMVHSPGVWGHSVGGHVRAGKTPREGALEELREEIFFGKRVPDAPVRFVTRYFHHDLPHNYEFLSVFEMVYPGPFSRGRKEVTKLKWIQMDELIQDMKRNPKKYAEAFHLVMQHYLAATRRTKRTPLRH
jgi:isopentenyldiphosphate isomerase